jgi:hypothetical protein
VPTSKAAAWPNGPSFNGAAGESSIGEKFIFSMEVNIKFYQTANPIKFKKLQWIWTYNEDNRFIELLGIDDYFSKRAFFDRFLFRYRSRAVAIGSDRS